MATRPAPAAYAPSQERQRCLVGGVARGRALPAQSAPPCGRGRRPPPLRRPGVAALDPAGDRRQVLRRRGDPKPGAGGQHRRPPRRDRRSHGHRPGGQHLRRGDPALAVRGAAASRRCGQGGGTGGPDAQAGGAVHRQRSLQPLPVGAGGQPHPGLHRAVPADEPGRLPRSQRADGEPAHLSPGRDHGPPCPGLRRSDLERLLEGQPGRRVQPGQPGRPERDRVAVREVPARGQRAPGLVGQRRWAGAGHDLEDAAAIGRHRRPQRRLRVATGCAERTGRPDLRRPPHPRSRGQRRAPAGHQRCGNRHGSPERPGAGHGLVPLLQPERMGGRHLQCQLRRPVRHRRREQRRHGRPLHPGFHVQVGHRHRGAAGRLDIAGLLLQRHGHLQDSGLPGTGCLRRHGMCPARQHR